MIRSRDDLVERRMTEDRVIALATTTGRRCPVHDEATLSGGPTWFTCQYGHGVPAADLSHEFQPRTEVAS